MEPSKTCSRCNSERLYAFEAGKDSRVAPGGLPVVCRDCGLITVAGVVTHFPPEFEAQAKSMAEAAIAAGAEVVWDIRSDADPKIANYFSRVYKSGYLDGFWRAVAFWKHNAKEGRIIRLRDLWERRYTFVDRKNIRTKDGDVVRVVMEMDETVYAEFSRLLELGADGTRSENQRSTVS